MKIFLNKLRGKIDESSYDIYKDEIRRLNLNNFTTGAFAGLMLAVVLLIISLLPLGILHMVYGYLSITIVLGIYYGLCKLVLPKRRMLILPIYYTFIVATLGTAILMGSVWGTNSNATTFLLLMVVFSLSIVDRPKNVRTVIGIMTLIFCMAVYFTKDHTLHNLDIMNALIFYVISTFVSAQIINTRMMDIIVKNQLKQQMDIDMLTQLNNRGSLERTVADYIHESNKNAALIIMDLDNFKMVNDRLGHSKGDELLKQVSDMLQKTFRSNDVVSRLGGDEFVVFLPDVTYVNVIRKKLDELLVEINNISFESEPNIKVGMSIGVAQYPNNGCTFEALYARADAALYTVKNNGKNGYEFYNTIDKTQILIVDDAEINRDVLSVAIGSIYHIIEASNGVEAMRVLTNNPDIDLVITDIVMPVMDGRELIKEIRAHKQFSNLPIIACTQFGEKEQEKELLELGIDDFIYKASSPEIIQLRIKSILK